MKRNSNFIIKELDKLYPNAKCELKHRSNFELLIAIILSAQTTDESVNLVTPILFKKYNTPSKLANAPLKDVEKIIKPIGLYRNKALNIIETSKKLVNKYKSKVPNNFNDLIELNGVGRKTANIILSNCFDTPAFAVDTHVARVSKRLQIADENDSILTIEEKLMDYFPKEKWCKLHHQFIFFGRYKCKALKPNCENCPFVSICGKAS